MPLISSQSFWLQKQGNSPSEYEDAYAQGASRSLRGYKSYRFAVADGATEASFSGEWAKQLVEAYAKGHLKSSFSDRLLSPLRREWADYVSRKPLPWYAEEKARDGTGSTLVGLTIRAPCARSGRANGLRPDAGEAGREGDWEALAVGDSCLFQVRDGLCEVRFPLDRSALFTNSPALLSSSPTRRSGLSNLVASKTGQYKVGDCFYLMTDALACWLLSELEAGTDTREVFRLVDAPLRGGAFAAWIAELRRTGRLRNDDVTLWRISIDR